MRFSLFQLARLRAWEDITISLIEQAIADTPDCTLDLDTEWDIDLAWIHEFAALRPALNRVLLDQFGVDVERIEWRAPKTPLTAVQRASAPHLLEYIESLEVSMKAVHDSLEREIFHDLAVVEAEALLERIHKQGLPNG